MRIYPAAASADCSRCPTRARAHALRARPRSSAHIRSASIRARAVAIRAHARSTLMGLQFPNRVGLAAGFDKNGRYIDALGALGFGFIEVGTVTPRPQPGQPRPRLFRVTAAQRADQSHGVSERGCRCGRSASGAATFAGVCGVNIGKNAATPIDAARRRLRRMLPHRRAARRLRGGQRVVAEYAKVCGSCRRPISCSRSSARWSKRVDSCRSRPAARVPLLVKVSPDLAPADLVRSARLACETGIDGIIATNTTLNRSGIAQRWRAQAGGLSGAPLRRLPCRRCSCCGRARCGVPIVAAGGIDSASPCPGCVRGGRRPGAGLHRSDLSGTGVGAGDAASRW